MNTFYPAAHQEAQSLIGELFHVDDLSPQNFQQAFFSVRGVLIAAAQKGGVRRHRLSLLL